MRLLSDLRLGARMAFSAGKDGHLRTALIALGTGLGVALLLLVASIPTALQSRSTRTDARQAQWADQGTRLGETLLVDGFGTTYHGTSVAGWAIWPEGPAAPLPPGVEALPGNGEIVVSPALRDLLRSSDGRLLVQRLGQPAIVGTIGDQGLLGPRELAFYLGDNSITSETADQRVPAFGQESPAEVYNATLQLLIIVITVVLLLPILICQAMATRFGGEARDRRMAALRLIGADRRMIRIMAVGEALVGAILGIALGWLIFLGGRQIVPLFSLSDISLYPSDLIPRTDLALLVMVLAVVLAAAAALTALRGVIIEPLGVTRIASQPRRRLWWRLIIPAAGLAALYPLFEGADPESGPPPAYQIVAGVILLLAGSVALLPWLVDRLVQALPTGPVAWHLAARQLRRNTATAVRFVNAVVIAVAGAIGLQLLFVAVQESNSADTSYDPNWATAMAHIVPVPGQPGNDFQQIVAQVRDIPGITVTSGVRRAWSTGDDSGDWNVPLLVGECADLAQYAKLGSCASGEVFLSRNPSTASINDQVGPGSVLHLFNGMGPEGEASIDWTVPRTARTVPQREDAVTTDGGNLSILATPAALDVAALRTLPIDLAVIHDPNDEDSLEHLRNVVVATNWYHSDVGVFKDRVEQDQFAKIRVGLYLGSVLTLLLLASSLLIGMLEQLRERRRLLSALVAAGARRSTLAWSVIWQSLIPITVGLALAVVFGIVLGAMLLRIVDLPLSVGWSAIAWSTLIAVGTILLVNTISIPPLLRLLRTDSLRVE